MRRGRKILRAAVATAVSTLVLLASPSTAHAAEGRSLLRGSAQQPQHEQQEYQERQLLLAEDESLADGEEENAMQEERTLAKRNKNDDDDDNNLVQIHPFRINLLDEHFPTGIKDDNKMCGVVSSYIAEYLSDVLDESVENLGLDCTKNKEKVGSETIWVLEIQGAATFDKPPKENVNVFIHEALEGTNKASFFKVIYPKYEVVKEKREWDSEHDHRLARHGQHSRSKEKNKRRKFNRKKKKKRQNNKKKYKKPQGGKQKPMKQMSGGGGQTLGNSKGDNLMGYVSGSQGKNSGDKDKGYEIINGDIYVDVKRYVGENNNNNKDSSDDSSNQSQNMQLQYAQGGKEKPQSSQPDKRPQQSKGGDNLMGYVSGSQGKSSNRDKDEGYKIKGGDIYVDVSGGGRE
eukprot:CAMPEP_0201668874 /NCGR_PEP_ID=MMETSP0494-20130426/21382_1 /ASSEMBLY_ACC=CAM_ASM_000839 /TAXON_ID=420259 /ORGANISM="Thalassiosira gravida, Strain GMp14c1" /LENGTH=402 /DNA_ID=CAMNT_0048149445 /DNA_START=318 /DNA_END=1526 /DNA_ORIENTATION=-